MKKVAVLIDGGFLSKIFYKNTKRYMSPADVILVAKKIINKDEELFRLYYYDCPPFEQTLINPISKKEIDFSANSFCAAQKNFQNQLAENDFVALRRGEIRAFGWKIKDAIFQQQIGTPKFTGALQHYHLDPNFRQKGLDMRIGLDMASLSVKRIVDKIAIVTGDTDFIPAMKYARREGTLVAIVDIGGKLRSDMKQHADQVMQLDLTKI